MKKIETLQMIAVPSDDGDDGTQVVDYIPIHAIEAVIDHGESGTRIYAAHERFRTKLPVAKVLALIGAVTAEPDEGVLRMRSYDKTPNAFRYGDRTWALRGWTTSEPRGDLTGVQFSGYADADDDTGYGNFSDVETLDFVGPAKVREAIGAELEYILDEVLGHIRGYEHSGARDAVGALRGLARLVEDRIARLNEPSR